MQKRLDLPELIAKQRDILAGIREDLLELRATQLRMLAQYRMDAQLLQDFAADALKPNMQCKFCNKQLSDNFAKFCSSECANDWNQDFLADSVWSDDALELKYNNN